MMIPDTTIIAGELYGQIHSLPSKTRILIHSIPCIEWTFNTKVVLRTAWMPKLSRILRADGTIEEPTPETIDDFRHRHNTFVNKTFHFDPAYTEFWRLLSIAIEDICRRELKPVIIPVNNIEKIFILVPDGDTSMEISDEITVNQAIFIELFHAFYFIDVLNAIDSLSKVYNDMLNQDEVTGVFWFIDKYLPEFEFSVFNHIISTAQQLALTDSSIHEALKDAFKQVKKIIRLLRDQPSRPSTALLPCEFFFGFDCDGNEVRCNRLFRRERSSGMEPFNFFCEEHKKQVRQNEKVPPSNC